MRRARRVILYVAAIVALAILVIEAVTLLTGWRKGVMHATRHQVDGEDRETAHGVFFNGSLIIYGKRGARTDLAGRVGGDLEYDTWTTTDDYSGGGVTSRVRPTFRIADWTVLDTGYRFGRADAPGVWSQHRLIRVGPLVICAICATVVAVATRAATNSVRVARRARSGHCRQCGYDLRGGHAQCPECGTPPTRTVA